MTKVSVEFDPEEGTLIIRGAGLEVTRHPLFAAYFRQTKGVVGQDGSLRMPTLADALSPRYQAVSKILDRIGIQLEAAGHVSDVLARVRAEEERFTEFSRQAYEIWHRQIDTDAFRSFISVVEERCPNRTFYRKQLLSAFHLAFAQNVCNFSVPGAGKTSVVYAAFSYLRSLPPEHDKHVDRLLIVGPLSSFKAWEDEYREIFGHAPVSMRIAGALPSADRAAYLRGVALESANTELTLTSYPTLASSEADFRIFLGQVGRRTMMVLDEAHYIKRGEGVWSAAALRLAPLASSRVILTGTPAPNGYEDLANLFRFIYPTKQIVGFPIASLRAMTDGAMPRAVSELKSNIRPFFTRIRKLDLNLPPVEEFRVPIPMQERQERIYRAIERRVVPQLRLALDEPSGPLRVKARLIRLRQAAVNPELLLRPLQEEGVFDTGGTGDFSISELEIAELVRAFDSTRELSRLQVCLQLARQILDVQGKVLIWSYFLGNLARLRSAFDGVAPFVEVLTGATPVAGEEDDEEFELGTRERIIDAFHRAGERAVLIANPQAVGESISLHKACRSAIYFDRDFNAGRFIQSKDRIHRYNPDGGGTVSYHHFVSSGTVDDDIDFRLIQKEQRLADLFDADDIPLLTADTDESAADIRAILEAYERRKTL